MRRVIEVVCVNDGEPRCFRVVVRDGRGETRHQVTMAAATCHALTGGTHAPERCIEAAFRFLLEREPKESILPHFDVAVISCYFPEFARDLARYFHPT